MKIMRAGMENENVKMRRIINVYIQSADLNDPAWEVMEEDDMGVHFLLLVNAFFLAVPRCCCRCDVDVNMSVSARFC